MKIILNKNNNKSIFIKYDKLFIVFPQIIYGHFFMYQKAFFEGIKHTYNFKTILNYLIAFTIY